MIDKLEIYHKDSKQPFLTLESSFQPVRGDLINIRGRTYKVLGRSFTVDHAATSDRSIRCNVIVEQV